ncbi:MAG: LytTR family DNA-binding domain-containing protein [Rikenellaceae bacterium]
MIKCIVIDDEPLALKQIEQYVKNTPILEFKGSFETAVEAMSFLRENDIDLLFVDINMPQITGLEFVEAISSDVKVIFVTAYREYALEGFALDAADYILKPLSYGTFLKSVEKVVNRYFDSDHNIKNHNDFIFVRSNYRSVRINFSDILYIESKREYMDIVLTSGEVINTHGSMGSISEKLPEEDFIRVHRSFIVNLNHVSVIERNSIIFGKKYIPINEQAREIIAQFTKGD